MKEIYTSDLQPNQLIVSEFLVLAKDLRHKKTGEGYLSLTLGDRTGEIEAKIWDNVDQVESSFERDNFVKVKCAVQLYQNRMQLTIHKLKRLEDSEVDLRDFLPRSAREPEEMWQELEAVVAGIGNAQLRALLQSILAMPEIAEKMKFAPAAKTLHHAFLGGLLEHVCSLCRLTKLVAQNYPEIDQDLVLAGVVLHDMGKIKELSYTRSFQYTTEGQLLGHIILELEILHKALADLTDFPKPLQMLLEHLIISHHGQYDFGSPKLPMFPEAMLLHYLDDMDSKLQNMHTALDRIPGEKQEWTGYIQSLSRPLLDVRKFLANASRSAEDSAMEPSTQSTKENLEK